MMKKKGAGKKAKEVKMEEGLDDEEEEDEHTPTRKQRITQVEVDRTIVFQCSPRSSSNSSKVVRIARSISTKQSSN